MNAMPGRRTIASVFSAIALMAATPAAAQPQPQPLDGLDDFVDELMERSHVPGVAIAVVTSDGVMARGYGVRTAGKKEAVDRDTLFAIGSITKSFTATAAAMMVADGKMDWDAPLTRYLSTLRFADPILSQQLTLRDALSHRTGLERGDFAWFTRPHTRREEMVALIGALQVEAPFRTAYIYNNFMFLAAGEAVAAAAGTSWDALVADRIFKPAGMTRTNTSVKALAGAGNVAAPHVVARNRARPVSYFDLDHVGPAGSINSSAADMAKWCQIQLHEGRVGDQQLIPGATVRALREPHAFMPLEKRGHVGTQHRAYGLGLERLNHGPFVAYTHGGAIQGMASIMTLVPERQICVVVLTNAEGSSGVRELVSEWIVDRLTGIARDDYLRAFEARHAAREQGFAAVRAQHARTHRPDAVSLPTAKQLTGIFSHPLYGRMRLYLDKGVLHSQLGGNAPARLVPHGDATFDIIDSNRDRADAQPAPAAITVMPSDGGAVRTILLNVPLPGQKPIRFDRIA